MNTVVYAINKEARDTLLSNRNVKETVVADSTLLLEYLRENSFKLFKAQIENVNELSLKTLGNIYRILLTNGQVEVKFNQVSKEDSEKLVKLLKATGFKETTLTENELVFTKPEFQQAASLKREVVQQAKTEQTQSTSTNTNVYGQYMHSPVVQVEPQQKKKNPFESVKIANNTVDEEALLKNDTVTTSAPAASSCATKAKACKDCNCGRKEKEQKINQIKGANIY